ncbi:MAG: YfjI family protein, partial [Actinomycetia bacterium]|nr:YfjI family protein [Actinomycetes bacterium]
LTPTIAVELFARISTQIGRKPFHRLPDGTHIRLNWWGLLIGSTSLSRKGTAQDIAERSMPPGAEGLRITNGIGSGQKLIELVSDPVYDEQGNLTGGFIDQRLLVDEPEYATILGASRYTGSTLSSTMRKLYDGKPVHHEVKSGSSHASGYHLGVVGAITPTELRTLLDDTSIANGFANRFQWFAGVDSIDIPLSIQEFPAARLDRIRDQLGRNMTKALAGNLELRWTPAAAELWKVAYPILKRPKGSETIQSLLARTSNHTIKIAGLYAIADGQTEIDAVHLEAALAWGRYSIDTVQWVYTAADADEWSRRILEVARARPGIAVNVSTEIHRAFSGPKRPASGEVWARIDALERDGWLHSFATPSKPGGGRPAKYVVATKPAGNGTKNG